jgi:Mlc titration factor MtfA (ptsG expression regulator)
MIALLPVLLLIGLSMYILYGFWLLIASQFKGYWKEIEFSLMSKRDISRLKKYEIHLLHRFPYYDRLPDNLKRKFLLRVHRFISDKSFESRGGMEVTDEMKTWVAASAVQLTFGLNNYSLSHFSRIILYPEAYYNSRTDSMHMGEANTRGIIVLSWQDLKEGYSSPSDNFNVGLHEMAHALELQLLLQGDYDSFFGNYYDKWNLIAQEEFENVESERASFFRKYAGTNKREFFAVCIEYFFESGEEFRERLPEIYYHLSVLLNQDPLQSDTMVKESHRKTNDELAQAINSIQPVLIPEYDFWSVFVPVSYTLLVLFFMVMKGVQNKPGLLFVAMAVGIVSALLLFTRMNKIILYENYLAVRSPFGKIKGIFELVDIIGISISKSRSGISINIYQARNGKIITNGFSFIARTEDIDHLGNLLKAKKIPVKF